MRTRGLRLSIIMFVLFLFVSEGSGAQPSILGDIKASTAYIFIKSQEGFIPRGTGFFVGLKIPSKPKSFVLCLVTAKHVLCRPGTTQFVDTVYLRLNKKGGGAELAAIPIKSQGKDKTLFMHSDVSVDLAAIPMLPDQKKYDFRFIPEQLILSKTSSANLSSYEGFEVFFPSLFSPYPGSGDMHPCVRFGRFALITDEKIIWQGKPTAMYLIDTGSRGANSGAPVFFYADTGSGPAGQSALKLAGILQGTFGNTSQEITEGNKTPRAFSSTGIAAVIPAYKLHELLFGDEMKKKRGF